VLYGCFIYGFDFSVLCVALWLEKVVVKGRVSAARDGQVRRFNSLLLFVVGKGRMCSMAIGTSRV